MNNEAASSFSSFNSSASFWTLLMHLNNAMLSLYRERFEDKHTYAIWSPEYYSSPFSSSFPDIK